MRWRGERARGEEEKVLSGGVGVRERERGYGVRAGRSSSGPGMFPMAALLYWKPTVLPYIAPPRCSRVCFSPSRFAVACCYGSGVICCCPDPTGARVR